MTVNSYVYPSNYKLIFKLWKHFTSRRQKQFLLLLILMLCGSFAEMISIGATLPFLGVLTSPERVYEHNLIQPFIELYNITKPDQLLLPITFLFILAAVISAIIRLILQYALIRLSFATGADLSIEIYCRTLYQKYEVHIARNSSEVINGIIRKTDTVIYSVIKPVLDLISSIILLIGVMIALLNIDFIIAITAFTGFGIIYYGIIRFTRKYLLENSRRVATESNQMIKSLQEGLGGIRNVLIDGTQNFYSQLYKNADLPLRKAQGNNQFITSSPRYVLEVVGITLIAGLAYNMSQQDGGITAAIPILGALALGAQRLMPALQLAYGSISSIKGSIVSLIDVLDLLNQPLPDFTHETNNKQIDFQEHINLNNISFRYKPVAPWVIKKISLKINKGNRIGFIGATGSGKSTLVDIIMGLLSPTKGEILIDNKVINSNNRHRWQSLISHVPQHIYLSDSSIEENIAFGLSKGEINFNRVQQAARQAQISELIESWPQKYETFVGENGIRLSGGQRQRIGIARALYKKSDVIIFDEATSALDHKTELGVMESLDYLGDGLTIIIIAHRLTTLKNCDQIIEIENNKILRVSNYNDLMKTVK